MKQRLDVFLTENNFAETRSRAQGIIMAGEVYINDQKADKAGMQITGEECIEVRSKSQKYVSRGGLKLAKALEVFGVNLTGLTCMDIGASTGGFTDCMLQNGAARVFAVDVGYGQLAWKLRNDARVVNLERTNIRNVTFGQIGESVDFITVDVSFISLELVLPVAYELMKENASAVCLIKPQFEAGRELVGKRGVVRDKKVHKDVINEVILFTKAQKFGIMGLDFSPVKGPEGNIEYLLYVKKNAESIDNIDVDGVVDASHELL